MQNIVFFFSQILCKTSLDSLIHKLLQSQKQIQAPISNDLQISEEIEVDSVIDVDLNNDSMQQTLNCRQCGNNIDLNCEINDNAIHQNLNSDSYESRVYLDEEQISADEVQISVDEEQISEDEDSTSEGLSTMDSYRAMCNEAGGEENLRHTKKDHLNYWTRLKMKNIEGGDAQAISKIMYQELANDPEFFFRFRLNKEGKLRALFWRDSMMREDYSIYGDVVVFDTTYRTNRYNLICALIVGINNHWKNCMFGCAFIGDEKIESFVWLLETFKKSMGGKCPISIFTDQDQAMCSAIQKWQLKVKPGRNKRSLLNLTATKLNALARTLKLLDGYATTASEYYTYIQ
uniref:MULE transposase domain-containing protein n=1 Tax=Chenopodium quinoa TaxID=63459 RepID=A0A803ML54_CHEQI